MTFVAYAVTMEIVIAVILASVGGLIWLSFCAGLIWLGFFRKPAAVVSGRKVEWEHLAW